jgi:uncharacterized protein
MNCPRCNSEMSEVVKSTVVVDVCAGCGGIFLDKGELAKILSQMKEAEATLNSELDAGRITERRPVEVQRPQYREDDRNRYERGYDKHHDDRDYHEYPKRKKSAFQNIFDIFD